MNPEYRKKIFSFLGENFSDFSTSEQDFYSKLDSDPEYAGSVYDVISGEFSDFGRERDEFISLLQAQEEPADPFFEGSEEPQAPSGESLRARPSVGFTASDDASGSTAVADRTVAERAADRTQSNYSYEDPNEVIRAARDEGKKSYISAENGRPIVMDDPNEYRQEIINELFNGGVISSRKESELAPDEVKHLDYKFNSTFIDADKADEYFTEMGWDTDATRTGDFFKRIAKSASGMLAGAAVGVKGLKDDILTAGSAADIDALKALHNGARTGRLTKNQFNEKKKELQEDILSSSGGLTGLLSGRLGTADHTSLGMTPEQAKNLVTMSYEEASGSNYGKSKPLNLKGDFDSAMNKILETNPETLDEFVTNDLAQGVGSLVGMAVTGPAAVGTATLAEMEGQRTAAIQSGDADSGLAQLGGAASGAIEGLAGVKLFKGLSKSLKAAKGNPVADILMSSATEGLTEGVQNTINNFTAQQLYDAQQELFTDETLREMLVGAVIGGGSTSIARTMGAISDKINSSKETTDGEATEQTTTDTPPDTSQSESTKEVVEEIKEDRQSDVSSEEGVAPTEGEPVNPQEGDTVVLKNRFGREETFEYKDGEWQNQLGGKVSKVVQDFAQDVWQSKIKESPVNEDTGDNLNQESQVQPDQVDTESIPEEVQNEQLEPNDTQEGIDPVQESEAFTKDEQPEKSNKPISKISERFSKATDGIIPEQEYTPVVQKEIAKDTERVIKEKGREAAYDEFLKMNRSAYSVDGLGRVAAGIASDIMAGSPVTKREKEIVDHFAKDVSLEQTNTGQSIAQLNKLYKDFPMLKTDMTVRKERAKNEEVLNDEFGGGKTKRDVIDDVTKDLENIDKDLKVEIEKLIKDNKRLSEFYEKTKQRENKVKGARKRRAEAKAKLKRAIRKPGSASMAVLPGINNEIVEAVLDIVRSYIDEGVVKASQVYDKVWGDVKGELTRAQYDSIINDLSEYQQLEDNPDGIKEQLEVTLGEAIDRIIIDIKSGRAGSKNKIADTIRKELGISENAARGLERAINKIVDDKVGDILRSRLEPKKEVSARRKAILKDRRRENRRIHENIMMGGLNSDSIKSAFQDKFGFKHISENQVAHITMLAERLFELNKTAADNKNVKKREEEAVVQKQFNTKLNELKKASLDSYIELGQALVYSGVLSGLNTQVNAHGGGFVQTTMYGLGFTIKELFAGSPLQVPKNTLRIARAAVKSARTWKVAFWRAYLAARTSNTIFNSTEFMVEGVHQERSDNMDKIAQSSFKGYLSKKHREAKGAGRISLSIIKKLAMQYRYMSYLLAAGDSFATTLSAEYVSDLMLTKEAMNANPNKAFKELNDIVRPDMDAYNHADIDTQVQEDYQSYRKFIIKEVGNDPSIEPSRKGQEIRKRLRRLTRGYKKRRKQELIENLKLENYQNAVRQTRSWILLGKPDGLPGVIYEKYSEIISVKETDPVIWALFKFALGSTLLFPRLMANMINMAGMATPVGLFSAHVGRTIDPNTGEYAKLDMRNVKSFFKATVNPDKAWTDFTVAALLNTATLALMADTFDWEEDEDGNRTLKLSPNRTFDFTAFGYNFKSKQGQQYAAFAYKLKDEEQWRQPVLAPYVLSGVAILGVIQDDLENKRGSKRARSMKVKSEFSAYKDAFKEGYGGALMEGSFNSLGKLGKNFMYSEGFFDGVMITLADMTGGVAGNAANPLLYRDLKENSQRLLSNMGIIPEVHQKSAVRFKDGTFMNFLAQSAIKGNLFEDYMLNVKKDPFGNPYPKRTFIEKWVDGYLIKQPEISQLFEKWGADIKIPRRIFRVNDNIPFKKTRRGKKHFFIPHNYDMLREYNEQVDEEFGRLFNKKPKYILNAPDVDEANERLSKMRRDAELSVGKKFYDKHKGDDSIREDL